MLRSTLRRVAAVVGVAGLLLAPTSVFAAGGDQAWLAHYNGTAGKSDSGTLLAVSPDGTKVFVAGISRGVGTSFDYVTVAYNATTGARLWVKRYDGPGHGYDQPHAIAVSPNGGTVFVTGESPAAGGYHQWATLAYSAATGTRKWVMRYGPSSKFNHYASALVVSPNSTRVYVTGGSGATTNGVAAYDFVTISYAAGTGKVIWANRYKHTANEGVAGTAIAVSSNGATVFATGDAPLAPDALTTIAYDAITGTRKWVKRDAAGEVVHAIKVAPDGGRIYVTGQGWDDAATADDWLTLAYSASTGGQVWLKRYTGGSEALAMAQSPDGTAVFVTGISQGPECPQAATIAYAAADGAEQWAKTYAPPNPAFCDGFEGDAIATSPDGQQVFITGWALGTVAYAAADGTQQWAKSYQGGGGNAIGVSADSLRTFITGGKKFSGTYDVTTIAYQSR